MRKTSSLSQYVGKRNDLPLGAKGSLQAMLIRSLGAGSFPRFWLHWNPVWGFYLSRHVMRPLAKHLPHGLAVLLTFSVSGALHDLAVTLIKWHPVFIFTPWFSLMGLIVLLSARFNITYQQQSLQVRMLINTCYLIVCFYVSSIVGVSAGA